MFTWITVYNARLLIKYEVLNMDLCRTIWIIIKINKLTS